MNFLAGVDEVGRGSIAGPVTAAAVILRNTNTINGLNDSKALSSHKRQELDSLIKEESISWNIAFISATKIDQINILQASLLAMKRAVEGLDFEPDKVLVDGLYKPDLSNPSEAIVKGDTKHESIMAASIIAKVARDKHMINLHKKYPQFQNGAIGSTWAAPARPRSSGESPGMFLGTFQCCFMTTDHT